MRVHFDAARRPARVAKALRAELERLGLKVGLARAHDLVASGFGYASYRELQAVCGTRPADPWDEDSPAAVVAARRARQVEAYAAAGITRAQAEAIVGRLRPSSRQACKGEPDVRAEGRPGAAVLPFQPPLPEPERLFEGEHDDAATIGRLLPAAADRDGPRSVLLENGWLLCADATAAEALAEAERVRALGRTVTVIRYAVPVLVASFKAPLSNAPPGLHASFGIPAARIRLRQVFRSAQDQGSGEVTIVQGPPGEPEVSGIHLRIDGADRLVSALAPDAAGLLLQEAFRLVLPRRDYDRSAILSGRMLRDAGLLPGGVQTARCQWMPRPDGGSRMDVRLFDARPVAGGPATVYPEHARSAIARMRRRPAGLNLVTGPAQSGKSMSLAAILAQEPGDPRRLVAIDDGMSPPIPGATQVAVPNRGDDPEVRLHAERGAIASALDLDPHILAIGEITHYRIAQAAFEAAMSGVQVWATIRAASSFAALDRLRDLGIELHRILDPALVTGLVGQRLVRRTCPRCAIGYAEAVAKGRVGAETIEAAERLAGGVGPTRLRFANPDGCQACLGGYRGRQLVAEAILPNDTVFAHLAKGEREEATYAWRRRDGRTMPEDAFRQVLSGTLDLREVETLVGFVDDIPEAILTSLQQVVEDPSGVPPGRADASERAVPVRVTG